MLFNVRAIFFKIQEQILEIMTVKEGKKLIEELRNEIKQGKDVEFNLAWINSLNKSILKASQLGYEKAMKNLQNT